MTRYQLLLRLRATRDCAWEQLYHRKARGRLQAAIGGTEAGRLHDGEMSPFTFSDPMPKDGRPGQPLEEGEEVYWLVSALRLPILEAIAADLEKRPEFEAGSLVLEARAGTEVPVDVGPPGNEGTVETSSGIILVTRPQYATETGSPEYWDGDLHDVGRFATELHDTAQRIIRQETELDPPPDEEPLFDDFHYLKEYALPLEVTHGNRITVIASKWHLGYEVRSERHREWLNAVVATGLGSKRSYGFGCIQLKTSTYEAATDAASVGAA